MRDESSSLSSMSNKDEELKAENEKLRYKIRQLMEDNLKLNQLISESEKITQENN